MARTFESTHASDSGPSCAAPAYRGAERACGGEGYLYRVDCDGWVTFRCSSCHTEGTFVAEHLKPESTSVEVRKAHDAATSIGRCYRQATG